MKGSNLSLFTDPSSNQTLFLKFKGGSNLTQIIKLACVILLFLRGSGWPPTYVATTLTIQ